MREMRAPLGILVILPIVLMTGCATSQVVHWGESPADVASRVADLSAEHKGKVKTLDGGHHWARNISVTADSVRWTRTQDGARQVMPLADVASIEIVTGRHAGKGALVGSLSLGGSLALLTGISCARETLADERCNEDGTVAVITASAVGGAAIGALIGAIIGASNADRIIFIPEDH